LPNSVILNWIGCNNNVEQMLTLANIGCHSPLICCIASKMSLSKFTCTLSPGFGLKLPLDMWGSLSETRVTALLTTVNISVVFTIAAFSNYDNVSLPVVVKESSVVYLVYWMKQSHCHCPLAYITSFIIQCSRLEVSYNSRNYSNSLLQVNNILTSLDTQTFIYKWNIIHNNTEATTNQCDLVRDIYQA